MRVRTLGLAPVLLLFGAAPQRQPSAEAPTVTIGSAEAEFRAATARAERLQRAADQIAGKLEKLRAEQAAAASALDATDARVTLADVRWATARRHAALARDRLEKAQRPASALLAGLALMARRPPILALTDPGDTDELIKARILLDSTLPVIRARSAGLAREVAQSDRLAARARSARTETLASRRSLAEQRARYDSLEQRVLAAAAAAGGAALGAGDRALMAGETVERLRDAETNERAIRRIAVELAAQPALPTRPGGRRDDRFRLPFEYRLPVVASVSEGLGAVDANGVRSRGLTLASRKGTEVAAPASGVVRFAGPFHQYDGVVIIDHGGGWLSLIAGMAPSVSVGERVAIGDPVGRAFGPLVVELSRGGTRYSPALIAGSSPPLSKRRKAG